MHPGDYEENVARGIHESYMPDYVHEFDLAEKLRIPVSELPNQPVGLVRAAAVLLEAETIVNRSRKDGQ